jgi:SAM-dependent methyltransferase
VPDTASEWDQRHAAGGRWDSGEPDEELQRVLKERRVQSGRALELGCGMGVNAVFLAAQGLDVTAVDVSPLAVQEAAARAAQARVSVRWLAADALELPDLGPPFDFVFDRGCYQHLRRANRFRLREVLARVTRPGSLYLTIVPSANQSDPRLRPPGGLFDYELCLDYPGLFELVELREYRVRGREVEGERFCQRAWSVLRRRKERP